MADQKQSKDWKAGDRVRLVRACDSSMGQIAAGATGAITSVNTNGARFGAAGVNVALDSGAWTMVRADDLEREPAAR